MYLVRRLVVGVEMPETTPWDAANLEAPSRIAVRSAFQLARSLHLPVTLVTVLPEPSTGWFGSEEDAAEQFEKLREESLAVLRDLSRQYTGLPDEKNDVQVIAASGRPWFEILRASGNAPDVMTVCGTRHQSLAGRVLFGSTGMKLLRNAAGPVWLVEPRPDDDDRLDILAATDLSPVGQDILTMSVEIANALESRLHVLHVVEGIPQRYLQRSARSADDTHLWLEKQREQAEHALQDQLSSTDYRTLQQGVQTHIRIGSAENSILEAIRDLKINLLIIATQARGGIAAMLPGGTAEQLLNEAPCSVIVIKPEDFVSPVQGLQTPYLR
ncbi:MAG: universal stress protein [Planctomyces sp.]